MKRFRVKPKGIQMSYKGKGYDISIKSSKIGTRVSDLKTGYVDVKEYTGKFGNIRTSTPIKYRDVYTFTSEKGILPTSNTLRLGDRTILINAPTSPSPVKVMTPSAISKTPFAKTFRFEKLGMIKPVPVKVPLPGGAGSATITGDSVVVETLKTELLVPVQAPSLEIVGPSVARAGLQPTFTFANLGATTTVSAAALLPISETKTTTNLKTITSPTLATTQPQTQPQQQGLGQTQTQIQPVEQINIPIITPVTEPIAPPPTPPPTTIQAPITPFEPPKAGLLKEPKKKSLMAEFKVFARRFGKDTEFATVKSKEEAKERLFGKLKKTLAASGYITKGGQKLKVSELGGLKPGFAPSKVDAFRIVEKKTKRLKKGSGETEEIKFFKGKRRKRGFGFGGLSSPRKSKSKKKGLLGL